MATKTKTAAKNRRKPTAGAAIAQAVGNLMLGVPAETPTLTDTPTQQLIVSTREEMTPLNEIGITGTCAMSVTQEELVNIPVTMFRRECEREIQAWTAKHKRTAGEENELFESVNRRLAYLLKLHTADRLEKLQDGLRRLGFKTKNGTSTHTGLNLDDLRVTITYTLSQAAESYTSNHLTQEEEFVIAVDAEQLLKAEINELKGLRKQMKVCESALSDWRAKLSQIPALREDAMAELSLRKMSQIRGGMEFIKTLAEDFSVGYLKDMPRSDAAE